MRIDSVKRSGSTIELKGSFQPADLRRVLAMADDGVFDLPVVTDDRILVNCPRCGAEQEDCDGFGVVHCEACGYCVHPAATGDICDICGADVTKQEAP